MERFMMETSELPARKPARVMQLFLVTSMIAQAECINRKTIHDRMLFSKN